MLREIPNTRQHPGELHRRWFHSHEQDLYVWEDETGEITAFQLCYDKPYGEHAFYWRTDRGYAHLRVNGGDHGWSNETPLLVADGHFPATSTLKRFCELGAELPPEIIDFVSNHILAYSTSKPKSP